MHAHGVEVFDGADDDAVVGSVAHHLHLVFFPADERFFDQQFSWSATASRPRCADFFELFAVVGDAATRAAQGEGGPDDERESPTSSATARASSMLCAMPELRAGPGRCAVIASLNCARSSALSMASALAPIISTPYFSSTPSRQLQRAVQRRSGRPWSAAARRAALCR